MSLGLVRQVFKVMLITGVILAPAVRSDALSDFMDLQTDINSAAMNIGSQTNSSRNWGFLGSSIQEIGTADLVQNISTTILKMNFNLNIDQLDWLNATNATNVGQNLTTLDDPYLDYISAIPNLSTALTALGRSWHTEMNKPVYDAIDALQQSITAFQTSLLSSGLIHTTSTLRTIRASSSLEDAQTAWSRLLNFPGSSSSSASSKRRSVATAIAVTSYKHYAPIEPNPDEENHMTKRTAQSKEPPPPKGKYYSHKDLWGRVPSPRQSREGKSRPYDGVVRQEERVAALRHGYTVLNARTVPCSLAIGRACPAHAPPSAAASASDIPKVVCRPIGGQTCHGPLSSKVAARDVRSRQHGPVSVRPAVSAPTASRAVRFVA